jgi:hypothetical protein
MSSHRPVYLSFFAVLFLYLHSCTKDHSQPKTSITTTASDTIRTAVVGISDMGSGNVYAVNDTVTFSGCAVRNTYHADSGYKFSWNFGDGTTALYSTAHAQLFSSPTHVYTATGVYTINLTVNDTLIAPPRSLTIVADPVYTRRLCTQRRWTGGKYNLYSSQTSDTAKTTLPDSTFAITYINQLCVNWNNNPFTCSTSYNADTILLCAGFEGSYIYYNVHKDSVGMYISKSGSMPGVHFYEQVWYHTP